MHMCPVHNACTAPATDKNIDERLLMAFVEYHHESDVSLGKNKQIACCLQAAEEEELEFCHAAASLVVVLFLVSSLRYKSPGFKLLCFVFRGLSAMSVDCISDGKCVLYLPETYSAVL